MSREILGQIACPECGGAAEVKRTKAGLAYRWCLDCHAQYFPRTTEASDRLIAKCGAATAAAKAAHTVTATATATATAPAPAPAPAPAKAKAQPTPTPATPRNGLSDALAMLGVK